MVSSLSSILMFSMFSLALIGVKGQRQVNVRKSRLDIVLGFSQSESFRNSGGWQDVYKGVKKWTEYFFRDDNRSRETTQMSVVGFHHSWRPLYFTTDHRRILQEIDRIMNVSEGGNSIAYGAERIRDKVLQFYNWDRWNAANIVFIFSDCNMHDESNDWPIVFLHDKCDLFMFICANTTNRPYPESQKNLAKWSKNDSRNIYNYTTYPQFQEYIDKRLAEHGQVEEIWVWDCKFEMVAQGGCELTSDGRCLKISYVKITQQPDPPEYGNACPANQTEMCPMHDCRPSTTPPWQPPTTPSWQPPTAPPWQPPTTQSPLEPPTLALTTSSSTTSTCTSGPGTGNGAGTGSGTGTGYGTGVGNSTGSGNGTDAGNGTGSGNGTDTGNGSGTGNGRGTESDAVVRAGGSSTKDKNMIAIIIGVSIGVLLLLLVVFLLLLVLLRRRRQKKTQEKASMSSSAEVKGERRCHQKKTQKKASESSSAKVTGARRHRQKKAQEKASKSTSAEVKGREHEQGVKADISVTPSKKMSKKVKPGKLPPAKSKNVSQKKTGSADGPSKTVKTRSSKKTAKK